MSSVYIVARDTTAGRSFHVKYRLHGRYGKVKHAGAFRTRREADLRKRTVEDWIAQAKDPAVELGRFFEPGASVGELASRWLASKRRIKPRTVSEYERRVTVIGSAFPMEARALTVQDVDRWVGELSLKHLPRTVREYVITLRAILDHVDGPNVARDRRIELPKPEVQILRPPDAGATLAVVARVPEHLRPVVVLMEQCGLRVSEACAVRPADVDRTASRLLVPVTKTGRPRWVPTPRWLVELLEPPWRTNRQTIHNSLKAACRLAGVEPFGPHMLRHRRASLWHSQGVTPVDAASWLGHRVDTYLRVYTHVMPVGEIEAQRLADLLR